MKKTWVKYFVHNRMIIRVSSPDKPGQLVPQCGRLCGN